jgi:pimeloyl-ACP methyl ester carboxylesterase
MPAAQAFAQRLESGLTLCGLRWQAGAPIRVLALHGWLDNANSFAPMAAHLPADIDLLALDLCGHGKSDHRPPGQWYHLVDFAYEAAAIARLLGWQRYHLLGHSLGGATTCLIAAANPGSSISLGLIEGLGPLAGKASDSGLRLRQAWQGLQQSSRDNLRLHDSPESAERARLSQNRMLASSVRLLIERSLQASDGGWQWRSDPRLRLASPVRFTETEILHILQAIECPVLQLLPDPPSTLMSMAIMQRRLAMMRDYRDERLSGYHHLHMDSPAECAARLFRFFQQHEPAAR